MDNLNLNEREIIEKLLTEYVNFLNNDDCVQIELIVDKERERYLLVEIGWDKGRRIYGVLIHIGILGNKLWIQQDGTEEGIADELANLGIPKERIVLAYKSLLRRKITEFAVN
jgi:hypothetical protein